MEQGELIQERYLLEERLGNGGMAEVWRALDQRLERSVAIKFLAPQLTADPEFLVRFFTEAQSVARISHSNVVSVLDFGEADDSPYLVMEYVPGGAVTEITGDPVLPERAAEIVRDAALGAGAAHELGIVHRDIKPGNVLICDDGRATVADFGIALTAFSEKLTATGQVIGSPHYISPEQAAGKGARPESDVYALGVVLYELLTGKPPFDADNATAIAIAHVDQEPEPPSARGADVTPELDALVLRCLAKDPSARFSNGTALASALELAVPSLAGLAPVMAAAAMSGPATVGDEAATGSFVTAEREIVETSSSRRGLLIAGAVLLVALLGAGAWATLGDGQSERPSVASASDDKDTTNKRSRPSPSFTDYEESDDGSLVTNATPTPKPTNDDDGSRDNGEIVVEREPGSGGGDNSNYYNEEEDTTESSPTPAASPTPEEEASTEPTPAPSDAPESDDSDSDSPE